MKTTNGVLTKYFTGGMLAKHMSKPQKRSSTPGKDKGETCRADSKDRYFAKRSRAYKDPEYARWCEKTRKYNLGA